MICQNCHKNLATVHVTEIVEIQESDGQAQKSAKEVSEQHLCEICAQTMDLPHTPASEHKTMADIWKLLQRSAQQNRQASGIVCPDCGMTLEEFRSKGRLGCPKDYEVFSAHVGGLLERVHGARRHVGRLPGVSDEELERMNAIDALEHDLEAAIREEAYERAARLRDEIQVLKAPAEAEREDEKRV